ncbi:MAG TPA: hypothetical protein VES20_11845 [Bryobacteraceae bacterium]|nr:hypothetical protein [Bryobacteraceae bacterium]
MKVHRYLLPASMALLAAAPLAATPPFGFSSQTFRGKITGNISAHQWNPGPLFTLLIQSSTEQWGLDVVQGTTEFAAADANGRPSQSGWHDHPTALSVAIVVQGTVWSHAAGSHCLRAFPTGSVFTEKMGEIHNNYNLDPKTPAIVRITHFVDRNQSATRRDQPDPVTGASTSGPPPSAVCTDSGDGSMHHGAATTQPGHAPLAPLSQTPNKLP